ncbi:hypothetical protein [Massilia yuzhufengensis]|uniref:Lipoprotein n=1 Tax=Massilia yuzhufengensis TaxID=1164594 RepID=A0A1I1RIR9_9BURK|nr:hypothetical protein [Massilia yuzhufengensis]SFD33937.1 hypothetical protein SAMN05216204_12282 [Massilia yuzhufengensis]
MKKTALLLLPLAVLASGCGTTNNYLANKSSTIEMYHIFDVKTSAPTAAIARAASDGLGRNTNSVNTNMPLQIGVEVPAKPGRFTITDLGAKLGNTGMGQLMQIASMQNGGSGMKMANCEGAAWTARAVRNISGSNSLTLHACLYKYRQGYHLDTYAVFQKTEGGLEQISRDLAHKLVGTPEEWVNKTIRDMVRSVETVAGAKATHVEGMPELGPEPAIAQLGR